MREETLEHILARAKGLEEKSAYIYELILSHPVIGATDGEPIGGYWIDLDIHVTRLRKAIERYLEQENNTRK